jgi:pimeloyl-ACP methyl ester carboxylesterase
MPKRRWGFRIFGGLVALAVLAYGGTIAWLMWHETALIFKPRTDMTTLAQTNGLHPATVRVPGADGATSVGWEVTAPADPASDCWTLYLHGNNANLTSRGNVTRIDQLRSLGLNVLAVEYPGFGDVPGIPTERGLMSAANTMYTYLRDVKHVPAEKIVIYGWSLGTGVAIPLASQVPEAAVVVEGAFTSVMRRAQALYPYLPIRWMVRNPFLSEDYVPAIKAPVLVLHSPEDQTIPFADGQKVYGLVSGPKEFVELRGGHITPNLDDEDRYLGGISGFLRAHTGCTVQEPRRSMGRALDALLRNQGLDAALAEYRRINATPDRDRYNLAAYELTYLASQLEERGHARDAQAIRALLSENPTLRTTNR